jgi:hypothetical protein
MGEFYFSSVQSAPGTGRFDGAWNVDIKCPDHIEGKTLARGYAFRFPAEVKDGVLHGQHKTKGSAGSLTVDGIINPDGTAELKANGVTDAPEFSVNNIARGTPYGYRIRARFDDAQGTGSRIDGRGCSFSFAKK